MNGRQRWTARTDGRDGRTAGTAGTAGTDARDGRQGRTAGTDGRQGRTPGTDGRDGRQGQTEASRDGRQGQTEGSRRGRTARTDGRQGQRQLRVLHGHSELAQFFKRFGWKEANLFYSRQDLVALGRRCHKSIRADCQRTCRMSLRTSRDDQFRHTLLCMMTIRLLMIR
ncbi:uncharacterized protein LOC144075915 isoform X3 [Stigmatopora argus]